MIQTSSAPVSAPGHGGRLKYAEPRELPSYPSSGLRPDGAAASAAATLGWSSQKSIECWKPDKTSQASAAAVLAKDYKMAPSWEPTSNPAGAKAALLAVGSAKAANKSANKSANKTTPAPRSPQDGWGSSAATQAFNASRANSMRQLHPSTSTKSLQSQRSLAAAQGAMKGTRPRAISTPAAPQTPESYPGKSLAASNALSGATLAHQASLRSKASTEGAGAVPITMMTRNMFTSHPPVKPEVDERLNNEKLHATAVEMARKMYSQQQRMVDQTKGSHGHDASTAAPKPKPYVDLQEAAYKQAQERLAKLQSEHQKNREFNEYYGNTSNTRHRFSLTSKLRRRSSSDGDLDDRQQSERIRQQMSLFSNKLSEIDEHKRKKDRDALLAVAQRNVTARLQDMDQKVYHETGQVNPTMLTEWEARAHQAAYTNHVSRTENKGKVDIGGGKFMNPEEVDAIASKKVQPILDSIKDKADAEHERQAALRMEEEARKAEAEKEKVREREIKDITRKLKEQDKQEEKAKKVEARATRTEQNRQAKEERRRPRPHSIAVGEYETYNITTHTADIRDEPSVEGFPAASIQTNTVITTNQRRKSDDSATSPTARMKGWIKNRFSRGKSLGDNDRQNDKRQSFLGGAALRGSELNRSTMSLDNRATSLRDVALAGRTNGFDINERDSIQDSRGVSPISSDDSGGAPEYTMSPPRPIGGRILRDSQSPSRDSRFREMMDH